jgi:hypothetical protein
VSAASLSLRSACERASIPSAQAVPLARVVSESRWSAWEASSAFLLRTAASINSGSAHVDALRSSKCSLA